MAGARTTRRAELVPVFGSARSAPFRTGWKNDKYDQATRETDHELDV
jgi:hypothetical protein